MKIKGWLFCIKIIIAAALLATPLAAQVNYQFHDTPRPEADVMLVNYSLRSVGTEVWLVGRVFNRGLKPARNVRVVPTITDRNGARYPSNTIFLKPSDVPPTSFAPFEMRVLAAVDPRNVIVRATAEWDP
ncbi:MAG: hypothetical protein HYU46_10340 [Deltaproteobacteria bacterium]|nr:hypothetical protein [Deltaproteobacteria bacterium]MBI2229480.1 hypothetical protein [Deltaproteobacteria bacterium]MBI2365777.1 hypothetical protein [Deltaproteobacteria bacterium]MBI2531769.1 hypothetical protein [Deltaproteobacteria bacterium]MBI3065426.1 hypothetical protein [Deltaproteobacteria bacterium]